MSSTCCFLLGETIDLCYRSGFPPPFLARTQLFISLACLLLSYVRTSSFTRIELCRLVLFSFQAANRFPILQVSLVLQPLGCSGRLKLCCGCCAYTVYEQQQNWTLNETCRPGTSPAAPLAATFISRGGIRGQLLLRHFRLIEKAHENMVARLCQTRETALNSN